jgi:hypothetical protein
MMSGALGGGSQLLGTASAYRLVDDLHHPRLQLSDDGGVIFGHAILSSQALNKTCKADTYQSGAVEP